METGQAVHRSTRQRKAILDELLRSRAHPTADELYAAVRKRLPRVSLGTVYRNLQELCDCGRVLKLHICGQPARFDGGGHDHYHLRCLKCGRIEDVLLDAPRDLNAMAAKACGCPVIGHSLEFIGTCRKCTGNRGNGRKAAK